MNSNQQMGKAKFQRSKLKQKASNNTMQNFFKARQLGQKDFRKRNPTYWYQTKDISGKIG